MTRTLLHATLGRLLLAVALLLPNATLASAAPPAAYDEALRLYRSGDAAGAAATLERAIESGESGPGHATLLGWCRLRLGETSAARSAFTHAQERDDSAAEPWSGLGYVALREGDAVAAESSFRGALARDGSSAEAWKGLALALEAQRRFAEARRALERAVAADPDDVELRARLQARSAIPIEERRPRPPVGPGTPLQAPVRAIAGRFEIAGESAATRPFVVRGINLSTALPGRFPSQFPDDEALYLDWFEQMGDLGANSVRLYTLHPPSLYRALHRYNTAHPERKLWLIQGVWAELPPAHDFDDPGFVDNLHREVRRVIDAVHGNLELPARPGHAHGVYDTDLSASLLAWLLGREWEPFAIDAYHRLRPGTRSFDGRYVLTGEVQPIDAWLATLLDTALAHESEYYGWQHPVAFASWPTLDPLTHPTESTFAEEMSLRGRLEEFGDRVDEAFNDDLVQVDPTRLQATERCVAGLFASYHVYPYHPDFLILDPRFAAARDDEGVNRYLGYLQELRAHHGTMPVLIAEYGVPTSRGISHLHPEGLHHGGHTSREQGRIALRLQRSIERAGLAGGLLFGWIDEWFKRNWLTVDFESPGERDPLWLNVLDPEEQYGLIAARPGREGWRIVLDGESDDWRDVEPLFAQATEQRPLRSVHVAADAAYLYLRVDLAPELGARLARAETDRAPTLWVGIDVYDADRGDHRFPPPVELDSPIGLEFVARFHGRDGRLLVDRDYDLFGEGSRRPWRSMPNHDGIYIAIAPETNRERISRDGTHHAALRHDRGRLRFGATDPGSADYDELADWYVAPAGRRLEARLPWALLQVADPSSRSVIHEQNRREGPVETVVTPGFRFHLLLTRPSGRRGRRSELLDRLPRGDAGVEDFPLFRWPTWEEPDFDLAPKESYEMLREAWRRPSADQHVE